MWSHDPGTFYPLMFLFRGRVSCRSHLIHQLSYASEKPPPEMPCPVCNRNQTHVNTRGETVFQTRLSACLVFKGLSIPNRTKLVENSMYYLCLAWKGGHTNENCTSKVKEKFYMNCDVNVDGIECGLRHHGLLHDCTVHEKPRANPRASFCNVVRGIDSHCSYHQYQALQSFQSQHPRFNSPPHSPELLFPCQQFLPALHWPSHPNLESQLPRPQSPTISRSQSAGQLTT